MLIKVVKGKTQNREVKGEEVVLVDHDYYKKWLIHGVQSTLSLFESTNKIKSLATFEV